jgi:replicative DNA helicase
MKINQRELEFKILKCITAYDGAVDIAIEKALQEYHFLTKEPGADISLTGKLFKLCHEYSKDSGGYKITETVLESLLLRKGVKPQTQAKFLNLWLEIADEETSKDELPHLVDLIKDRYCVKLQTEMVDKMAEYVQNDQIKDSIALITDYVNAMTQEQDEFSKDKVEFNMSEASTFFFEEYDNRAANMDLFKGINCGLSQIDQKTFGFMPSQLVCLLAPSSGGKSVQLLNWADHAHRVCKKNVLYFSFEMSSWLCKLRHASLISQVDYSRLKSISISPSEREKLEKSFKEIDNGKYFEYMEAIEDPTPEFIEQKIREITATKGKPDLVVADYIGNMTTRSTSKNAKHWEKNGDAAEGLFKVAKRYGIPILTAQQINRDSIKENRKRKEDGKASAYYQDAASGDQRLMHLSTYVIGMEPNKEDQLCKYYPVKMRDAWFKPFDARWIPEYNKVEELTDSEQSALDLISNADVKNYESTNTKKTYNNFENIETDLSNWTENFDF